MRVAIDLEPGELYFDFAALQALERVMGGAPCGTIFANIRQLSISGLVGAVWAGSLHADRRLDLATVQKRLTRHLAEGKSLAPLFDALATAIDQSPVFAPPPLPAAGHEPAPVSQERSAPPLDVETPAAAPPSKSPRRRTRAEKGAAA